MALKGFPFYLFIFLPEGKKRAVHTRDALRFCFLLLFSLSFSPLLHPLSRISLSCGYGPVWVLLAQSDLLLSLPSAPCYGCWCYGNLGDMPAPQSQGHQLHPPPPAPFSPKHPLKKVSAASCGKPRGCSLWPLACRLSSCSAAFPPLVPGTAFLCANPHTRPVCACILHTKGRKVHVRALEVFEIICCKPLYHSTKALTGASVPTHVCVHGDPCSRWQRLSKGQSCLLPPPRGDKAHREGGLVTRQKRSRWVSRFPLLCWLLGLRGRGRA